MVGSRPPRVLFPSLPRLFRRGGRRPLSPRLARSFVENSTLSFFSAPSTNGLQRTLINSLVLAERSRLPVHRSRGHASREEIGVDNFNSREVKKEEEGEIILDDAALSNEPVKIIYRSFPLNSHCIVSFLLLFPDIATITSDIGHERKNPYENRPFHRLLFPTQALIPSSRMGGEERA